MFKEKRNVTKILLPLRMEYHEKPNMVPDDLLWCDILIWTKWRKKLSIDNDY